MKPDQTFAAALGRALINKDTFLPPDLLARIAATYDETLDYCGPSPQSVLWRSTGSQRSRFRILMKVMGRDRWRRGMVINDLGCGYGAFFDYLAGKRCLGGGRYIGYDLCPAMIDAAKTAFGDPRATFHHAAEVLDEADYSFASGTFGLCLDAKPDAWAAIVRDTLRQLAAKSRRGLAFNLLDKDGPLCKPDLYYSDPDEWLAFARAELGTSARLIRGRPEGDFAILVRRDG